MDTTNSTWGIQEWNSSIVADGGQKFTTKTPLVLTDADTTIKAEAGIYGRQPKASVGAIGDYAVLFETVFGEGTYNGDKETARIFYKSPGNIGTGVGA